MLVPSAVVTVMLAAPMVVMSRVAVIWVAVTATPMMPTPAPFRDANFEKIGMLRVVG
jgi:hypothetical protein